MWLSIKRGHLDHFWSKLAHRKKCYVKGFSCAFLFLPSFPLLFLPFLLLFPPSLPSFFSLPPFTLLSLSFPFSSLTFAYTLPFQSSVGSISNSDTQVHCMASFWYLLETTNISISAGILWNLLKDNLLKAFDLENGKGKEIARFLEVFEIKGFG